jgi:hypothetical protein
MRESIRNFKAGMGVDKPGCILCGFVARESFFDNAAYQLAVPTVCRHGGLASLA